MPPAAAARTAAATCAADHVLDLDHGVGECVERRLELVEGLVGVLRRCDGDRRRAEDLGGDDVEQGRLAQRLARFGGEEVVAPGDQVVEVRHDRALHVGDGAQVGEQERVEGIVAPGLDLGDGGRDRPG